VHVRVDIADGVVLQIEILEVIQRRKRARWNARDDVGPKAPVALLNFAASAIIISVQYNIYIYIYNLNTVII
jgi:hypothetical protein